MLYNAGFEPDQIAPKGAKRYSVVFTHAEEANLFVENGIKKVDAKWGAYIPNDYLYKSRLLTEIPHVREETLMKGLRGEQRDPILGFKLIFKTIRTNTGMRDIVSSDVKVICNGEVPKFLILIGSFQFVKLFVQPVLRCRK